VRRAPRPRREQRASPPAARLTEWFSAPAEK
jgi:hypothetical protein